MMCKMGLGQNTGTMVRPMKANIRMVSNLVMEHLNGLMGQNILESLLMEI